MKRRCIIGTILLSIAILSIYTFYKVNTNHLNLVMKVTEKRIIEAAQNCIWDDVCKSYPVTLDTLIKKGYLEEEVNPKTKIYYSHDSYIEKKENILVFHGL